MNFDPYGYLTPHKAIKMDLVTFGELFVDAFTTSATRQRLFERYLEYNEMLKELIPDGYSQWINGSFVTKKQNPADMDLVTFVNYDLLQEKDEHFRRLRELRFKRRAEVDGYFITVYPENHRLFPLYQYDQAEWFFNFTRTYPKPGIARQNKGFIELTY